MRMSTVIITTVISLLSLLAGIIAARIRRRFARDIRIVFKTGQRIVVPIESDTQDYKVFRKIVKVVDDVLFGDRRVIVQHSLSDKEVKRVFVFGSPVLAETKILGIEKGRGLDKSLVLPTSHVTSAFGHFEKVAMSKHVEMRPFDKDTKIKRAPKMGLGHRMEVYSTAWRKERTSNRIRSADWMQKHSEDFPVAAG
jgi:hypothetical protein